MSCKGKIQVQHQICNLPPPCFSQQGYVLGTHLIAVGGQSGRIFSEVCKEGQAEAITEFVPVPLSRQTHRAHAFATAQRWDWPCVNVKLKQDINCSKFFIYLELAIKTKFFCLELLVKIALRRPAVNGFLCLLGYILIEVISDLTEHCYTFLSKVI